jgi:hypothetical protein
VPVHDAAHDPVARLQRTIELGVEQSLQLVAGFRGVGKTTEFSRLEAQLRGRGYVVLRVDLEAYLDMHSSVDVRDFLLTLAWAISDALLASGALDEEEALRLGFSHRVKDFLAGLEDTTMAVRDASGAVNWRVSIKESLEFREQIRRTLGANLSQLEGTVRAYVAAIVAALRAGGGRRLVVVVDSLEHIRGTPDTASDIHASVRDLFLTHGKRFEFADAHMVFSVPAFMALKADNVAGAFVNGAVQAWAAFHIAARHGDELVADEATVARVIALVERRIDWRLLLPDDAALRSVITASGGYVRDLLNLLMEALHQAGPRRGRARRPRAGDRPRAAQLPPALRRRDRAPAQDRRGARRAGARLLGARAPRGLLRRPRGALLPQRRLLVRRPPHGEAGAVSPWPWRTRARRRGG